MHSREGTHKAAWSFLSSKDSRPNSRRGSFDKRARAPIVCSSAVKHKQQQRTTLAFRDQESAKSRLVPPGSDEQKVLHSSSHSLFGHPASLDSKYDQEGELGRGGNAIIYQVKCRQTGKQYACKTIKKELEGSQWSEQKKKGHLDAIRQEVEVLRRLRGSLNVATLEDIFEDDTSVHIITEICKGGELVHRIGNKHYSERTVASYMRAVLRTIAQCHAQKILHRDIKPGNFLLLSDDEMAPLKAIDFGLAVPFKSNELPKQDLGLEGTPWYQAPEVLGSKVGPAADVWSAGVMAFQLLTGRFPFDDRRNPLQPSVTKIWQSILCDKVDFKKSYWSGVSEEAQHFVARLLEKDPEKRPTAEEALGMPWLRGHAKERAMGEPLCNHVVQRIQRYSQSSVLKRTALELIAEDMLSHAMQEIGEDMSSQAGADEDDSWEDRVEDLIQQAHFGSSDHISRHQLSCVLQSLGYRIDVREEEALLDQLDTRHMGEVYKGQLAASQIDWAAVQRNNQPRFLEAARHAFAKLDTDGDGVWSCEEILDCLQSRLAPAQVSAALQQAMQEAAKRDESIHKGINFEAFLTMLRSDPHDSLEMYDDRIGSPADRLSLLLDSTCRIDYSDLPTADMVSDAE